MVVIVLGCCEGFYIIVKGCDNMGML